MNKNELGYHRVMAWVAKYDNYSKMVACSIIHNPYFFEHIKEDKLIITQLLYD